jgi:hypothetical protein
MVRQRTTKSDDEPRDLGVELGRPKEFQTTVRLDDATKFATEWIARVKGYSLIAAYRHAITIYAESLEWKGKDLHDFFHPSEAVRWCRMLIAGVPLDDSETRRGEFVLAHKPFFFVKHGKEWIANEQTIAVLWPHVDYHADHWFKRREVDAWATGEKMADVLKDAKCIPPPWGPKAEIER